jgi:hypothetical protein
VDIIRVTGAVPRVEKLVRVGVANPLGMTETPDLSKLGEIPTPIPIMSKLLASF